MDLKAKHHKLGSQGLRGAQQTISCKKKGSKIKDKKEKEEKNSRQVQFMAQDYKTGHTGGRKELL